MAIVTANITAGATTGSELATVAAAVANGTVVVVCRGEFVLGSGVVSAGVASVAVAPLAAGDILQASVTERGNQAGLPVLVSASPTQTSGWLSPATVRVINPNGTSTDYTAAAYLAAFGETPGAVYDPLAAGVSRLPVDYDKLPTVELGFDIEITRQAGSSSLRVVPRGSEALLVGYNGAAPGSPVALSVTATGTVSVTVQRDDATGALTRSIPVTVLPTPSSTPTSGDIIATAYRIQDGGVLLRGFINSKKPCEALLQGFTTGYIPGVSQDIQYQEVAWSNPPPPPGTYTMTCRVIGETNAANFTNVVITF